MGVPITSWIAYTEYSCWKRFLKNVKKIMGEIWYDLADDFGQQGLLKPDMAFTRKERGNTKAACFSRYRLQTHPLQNTWNGLKNCRLARFLLATQNHTICIVLWHIDQSLPTHTNTTNMHCDEETVLLQPKTQNFIVLYLMLNLILYPSNSYCSWSAPFSTEICIMKEIQTKTQILLQMLSLHLILA